MKALGSTAKKFNIQPEEKDMPLLNLPETLPQDFPIVMLVAEASQQNAQVAEDKPFGSMGVCLAIPQGPVIEKDAMGLVPYDLSLRFTASLYWNLKYPEFAAEGGVSLSPSDVEKAMHGEKLTTYDRYDSEDATVTVLEQPEHGKLSKDLSPHKTISYYPVPDYQGNDKAVFLVNLQGYNIKVTYDFKVVDFRPFENLSSLAREKHCPDPYIWRISTTSDTHFSAINFDVMSPTSLWMLQSAGLISQLE
ncbi:hypothetical protein [Methylobacter luteus]|uniref:hypothetical protein n=1 Tax=Methylobacter luteus TaxID=415 RepID=UPI0012DDD035|nr:hypothetical protein [Methylobacter luteus]